MVTNKEFLTGRAAELLNELNNLRAGRNAQEKDRAIPALPLRLLDQRLQRDPNDLFLTDPSFIY